MTIRHVYEIKDHQLTINLPNNFKNTKKILITIDEVTGTRSEKLLQLKEGNQ